jgi:hypothetical protein
MMRPPRLPILLCAISISSRASAAGAVEIAALQATQSLGQTPASSVVVAAPLASDQPAPKGNDLALRIAALIAGRIGASARAHPQTAQLGSARAIAGRAGALVYVQTEISRGDLRTTVDVYRSTANAWDRIRNPLASPASHAFASVPIDAEVRSFLVPLLLEQARVHRARHDEPDVLAAACGDIDGDGGDEIVLVSRGRVAMGRVHGGRFVVERAAAWSELAPRAPVPMREPLAGAAFGSGVVAVGSTERGSLSLTPDFLGRVALRGVPAWGGDGVVCLMPERSAGAFDGAPFDCAIARDLKPKMAVPAPRFDAFAAATIADVQGSARAVVAVREPSGKLKLKIGEAPLHAPDGTFGAQLAVADLDQDGVPEIATSAEGLDDAVDIWSFASVSEGLRTRLHIPTPAAVSALAVCPPEEHGEPALVAVVGNELWIVRAGMPESRASRAAGPADEPSAPRARSQSVELR